MSKIPENEPTTDLIMLRLHKYTENKQYYVFRGPEFLEEKNQHRPDNA